MTVDNLPPTAKVYSYDLTLLPREWRSSGFWHLTVEWRSVDENGEDQWAVCWLGRCASRSGSWSFERSPGNRSDQWRKAHQFSFTDAMALAEKLLPEIQIDGKTAADVLAERLKKETRLKAIGSGKPFE